MFYYHPPRAFPTSHAKLPAIFTYVTHFLSCVLCSGTSSACDVLFPLLFLGYKPHLFRIVGSSLGYSYFPVAQSLQLEALLQQTFSITYLWIRWSYTTLCHLVSKKSVNCIAFSERNTELMSKLPRWEKKGEYTSTMSQKWWLRDVCSLTYNSAQKL